MKSKTLERCLPCMAAEAAEAVHSRRAAEATSTDCLRSLSVLPALSYYHRLIPASSSFSSFFILIVVIVCMFSYFSLLFFSTFPQPSFLLFSLFQLFSLFPFHVFMFLFLYRALELVSWVTPWQPSVRLSHSLYIERKLSACLYSFLNALIRVHCDVIRYDTIRYDILFALKN